MADATTATTTAADTTTAATATTATVAPWHQGIDGELVGLAQNKGWKLDDPKAAFGAAAQAYREAQSKLGAPPELLLRLPKDATDEAGWKAVYGRLGVPEAAKDYDFAGIKRASGAELDAGLADTLRTAMLGARVPKDRAGDVVKAVVKHMDGIEIEAAAVRAGKLAEEKAALAANWKANEPAFKFIAQQAATKLGIVPEAVAALEGVIGYKAIMEMFHKIGTAIGEDKFVASPGGQGGPMTRDQAVARYAELKSDPAWVARHNGGGAAERREKQALVAIMSGVSAAA